MNGMNMGANTIAGGQKMQLSGLSSILNSQTQTYINSNDSFMGDAGAFLGGAASLAKAGGFAALSDRRVKENIKEVSVDQRTALPIYEFNYRREFGNPDIRYRGVMADDVELIHPEAIIETDLGFKSVNYEMLGIEFKEVSHG
jgi:hypothetical protein